MQFAITELEKTLSYHRRQLNENALKIEKNMESNAALKEGNLKHQQSINQIEQAIEKLKG